MASLPGPASPVQFWPDYFLEIGRTCPCAYDEVGVAPTHGGASACVCKLLLWPAVSPHGLFKLLISRQLLISRPHCSFFPSARLVKRIVNAKIIFITTKLTSKDIKTGQVGLITQKLLAPALITYSKRTTQNLPSTL